MQNLCVDAVCSASATFRIDGCNLGPGEFPALPPAQLIGERECPSLRPWPCGGMACVYHTVQLVTDSASVRVQHLGDDWVDAVARFDSQEAMALFVTYRDSGTGGRGGHRLEGSWRSGRLRHAKTLIACSGR
jgi:hypothetical protein